LFSVSQLSKESSLETWGNTKTLGGNQGNCEDGNHGNGNEACKKEVYTDYDQDDTYGILSDQDYWDGDGQVHDDEVHDEEVYDAYDRDDSGQLHPSKHVWLSDEEKVRIAFGRVRTNAAKVELDRSPFFPRTAAEYVGLKADMVEARAARLKTKVTEKEALLRGLRNPRWTAVLVVGPSGQIEEKIIPLSYDGQEGDADRAGKVVEPQHGKKSARYVFHCRLMAFANNPSNSDNTDADNDGDEAVCSAHQAAMYVNSQTTS